MVRHRSTLLTTFAIAAWGSIAAATVVIRRIRRRKNREREERVAKAGGFLFPQAKNVVEALEIRGTGDTENKLALVGANGKEYTWKEYNDEVKKFAKCLSSLVGVNGVNGVAIHAFNSPRWFISALGALAAGWTVSGIYQTNTYDQAKHIIKTSDVRVLVLQDEGLLESTYGCVLKEFPQLTIVLLEDFTSSCIDKAKSTRIMTYTDFVTNTAMMAPSGTTLNSISPKSDTVACLVYTSGTTGNPKAVELTHKSIQKCCAMMHARVPVNETTVIVSYLPLSHIAAMCIDMFSPIFHGGEVHFADADALRGTLKDTLLRVRPTLFFGVPRVWEKMASAMQDAAAKTYEKPLVGPLLRTVGVAAKAIGSIWWSSETPELVRCLLTIPFGLFKVIAFKKVRKGCGLDRCGLLYTGAAPLSADTINYLRSLDMPLLEVFGMSESCGAIAVCGPFDGDRPLGACGKPLCFGKLEIAADGEIVWQGDNNMRGYKDLPDDTASTLSKASQLHTGDIGIIDKAGYLHVTGRKKDIIITAGGENIAPKPIEDVIMTLLHGHAGHIILVGDRRKFLTVLIAPTEDSTMLPSSADVEAALKTYNDEYAKSRAQRIQKAHVLAAPFTVGTGELTPTMKIKRAFVVNKYTSDIDAMYKDGASGLVGYSSISFDSPE